MKFNFNMTVKGLPTADIKCEFECTNDELVTLISDPVYQELGRKLISEVSFAPKAQPKQQEVDASSVMAELDKRVNSVLSSVLSQVKRELDADRKARETSLHITEKLMDRASKLAERNKF